jgi:RNA recognition motif-containing protein
MTDEEMRAQRAALDEEWSQFRKERAAFEEERMSSGLEYKLFIGNLDPATGAEELRTLFDPFGAIKEVVILKDREGNSKRSGFIKYFIKANAEAAVEQISGKHTDGSSQQPIVVRFADQKPKSMPGVAGAGVTGIAGIAGGYAPQQQYQQQYGMGTGAYGGMAAGMGQMGGVHGAMGMGNGSSGGGYGRGPPGANLYINNLSHQATEMDVRTMFSDYGNVVSVKVFAGQGYGFVSFDNVQSAQAAINTLDGLAMAHGNKRLEVRLKK